MVAKGRAVYFGEDCERRSPSGETVLRSRIVRIGSTGAARRFPVSAEGFIDAIAVGPEGTVWFASPGYSYSLVGWIDRAGTAIEFHVHHSMTTSIAVGRDGRLWFPASFGGQSYRALNSISRKGDLGKPFCIDPECALLPRDLTAAPDGSIWYSTSGVTSVGGGGGAHQIQGLAIENEPGAIGHLPL
jgi:virginiamycin B lyase